MVSWKRAVLSHSSRLGQCDVDGKAINNFPQGVLDAEIAYEKSFPTKDVATLFRQRGLIADVNTTERKCWKTRQERRIG